MLSRRAILKGIFIIFVLGAVDPPKVTTTTTTTPKVTKPMILPPIVTKLKCYGKELKPEKWDSFCYTQHGNKTADDKSGPCKLIDCIALSNNRLPEDSKDYPRACFSHSINQFNGKYQRVHSCGPDRGEVIPYMLMKMSFDEASGLDNGFLRKTLQEDCRVFEIHRTDVGKKRVCYKDTRVGLCKAEYVDPGANGEYLEKLLRQGGSVCPGRYICRTENGTGADGKPETFCLCEEGFKACHFEVLSDGRRGCTQKFIRKTEIGPMDAVCDFASELLIDSSCLYNVEKGCVCPKPSEPGTGNHTLTAYCNTFPGFKVDVMQDQMKDFCRKKTQSTDGSWFPVGYEAEENSFCYCNKGETPCNEAAATNARRSFIFILFFTSSALFKDNA